MRRRFIPVHPALLRREEPCAAGEGDGLLFLVLTFLSGVVFAAFVVALIWGFALLEAVLT